MKIFLISLISFMQLFANTSLKNININHHAFSFVEESFQEYSDKGVVIKIYDKNDTKLQNPLFSFILEDIQGGCSAKSIQKGSYKIEGSKILFYSHWSRQGKEFFSPYGARIMEYTVDEEGTFKNISTQLYIEEHKLEKDEKSGMQYLFEIPKIEAQKQLLKAYVSRVEKKYKGTFLFDQEAQALMEEVKKALKKQMKQRWRGAVE